MLKQPCRVEDLNSGPSSVNRTAERRFERRLGGVARRDADDARFRALGFDADLGVRHLERWPNVAHAGLIRDIHQFGSVGRDGWDLIDAAIGDLLRLAGRRSATRVHRNAPHVLGDTHSREQQPAVLAYGRHLLDRISVGKLPGRPRNLPIPGRDGDFPEVRKLLLGRRVEDLAALPLLGSMDGRNAAQCLKRQRWCGGATLPS